MNFKVKGMISETNKVFLEANIEFALRNKDLKDGFTKYLKEIIKKIE